MTCTIIKFEIEDIISHKLGVNIAINPKSGPTIIFSKEAALEFAKDIKEICEQMQSSENGDQK